jgi:hypothetical protein
VVSVHLGYATPDFRFVACFGYSFKVVVSCRK